MIRLKFKKKLNIKKINIFLIALYLSLEVAQLGFGQLINFHTLRLVPIILLINIIVFRLQPIRNIALFLIVAVLYGVAILDSFFFVIIQLEVIKTITVLITLVVLNSFVKNKEDYNLFKDYTFKLTFGLLSIAAAIGFYKFNLLVQGISIPSMELPRGGYVSGSSLSKDYNLFSLSMVFGIYSGKYIYDNFKSKVLKFAILGFQLLMVVSTIFSSSRRGLIFVSLSLVILLFLEIKPRNHSYKSFFNHFKFNHYLFLIILTGIVYISSLNLRSLSLFKSLDAIRIIQRLSSIEDKKSFSNRTNRWDFAFKLFDSYSIDQKFIGDGFNYLIDYKKLTNQKNIGDDYPHNFFISILLYNGFLGMVFYSLFLLQVAYNYYLRWQEHIIFIFWAFFSLIVAFTSSNTLFSNWTTTFLLLLPLLNFNRNLGRNN